MIQKLLITIFSCSLVLIINSKTITSFAYSHGAIVRGDSTKKEIALVFTGDEFGDGLPTIAKTLSQQNAKASFFFTGRFYSNTSFKLYLLQLHKNGNYLSLHSNDHLLYCDWNKRDSLFVTRDSFTTDLHKNIEAIKSLRLAVPEHKYFIPPYEWWNDSVAAWSKTDGWQLVNYTPGIITAADYTYPGMASYKSSEELMQSLKRFEANNPNHLNGAIILIHAGTDPRRKDKLYNRLEELIEYLKNRNYRFARVDELLSVNNNE